MKQSTMMYIDFHVSPSNFGKLTAAGVKSYFTVLPNTQTHDMYWWNYSDDVVARLILNAALVNTSSIEADSICMSTTTASDMIDF